MPPRRIRIGILVPSSNTALEPITTAICASLPVDEYNVTVHFSRFPVTTIALSSSALSQFDVEKILPAARLLADAGVDVIGWSGTSAGWLGFDRDVELVRLIEKDTGIKATTSVLALNIILKKLAVVNVGLVTPYLDDVQAAIISNYGGINIDMRHERHLSISDNLHIGELGFEELNSMVEAVVKEGVTTISTFCTNLNTARYAQRWERELNVLILDTVTTVVWHALRICGVDTKNIKGWGKMMDMDLEDD